MRWKERELWQFSVLEDEGLSFDPDLLCEDGWLTAEELATEEDIHALLRKAIRRGFLADVGLDEATEPALWWKESDIHRIWNDLVNEDIRLRAPPGSLAV